MLAFEFTPLDVYGRETLVAQLMKDPATTSYKSKTELSEKILTDFKVGGFVVKFFEESSEKITAGFVLDCNNSEHITDMYTFIDGRGKFLFNNIAGHYFNNLNWTGSFKYDENNAAMKEFFEKAAANPHPKPVANL